MTTKFQGTENYVATQDLMLAVNAAITLRRPLLVKGEPGTGKTMLAEEVALALNLLGFRVDAERDTVYSMAFFAFWFVTSLVGLAVWSLTQSAARSPDARHPDATGQGSLPPNDRGH